MEIEQSLDRLVIALEGTTVLLKPRVSRDVIIEVLKEHTELIRDLRKDLKLANKTVECQADELKNLHTIIDGMNDEIKRNKAEIGGVRKANIKTTEEIKEIKQEIAIQTLKIASLGNIMELEQMTHKLTMDYNDFKKETKMSVNSLFDKGKESTKKIEDVVKMVKETGETLLLPSSQVMVDVPSSTSGGPIQSLKLADVLAEYNTILANTKTTLQEQLTQITINKTDISTKADATVTFDIDGLSNRLRVVEKQVKKDSEQGVGEIRRQCEELTTTMESIQIDLAEKINRDSVELIVHKKYEDIVQYLHEALQASKTDEEMFNKKADELRDAVKRLGISKADRFEIASMQETVVKTESLLAKLKGGGGETGGGGGGEGTLVTRAELMDLLAAKLDKSELEHLQSRGGGGGGGSGAQKKRSLVSAGYGDVPDLAMANNNIAPNYIRGETMLRAPQEGYNSNSPIRPTSLTSSDNQPSTSQKIMAAAGVSTAGTSAKYASSSLAAKEYRSPLGKMERERERDRSERRASSTEATHQSESDRVATVRVPVASSDLGSFLKLSTLQSAGRAMFPTDLFRTNASAATVNTEGGGVSSAPRTTEYELGVKPDMSYVGASIVGAGFNTRNANILKGPPLAPLNAPSPEGQTVMVKGADGHFYHTDSS